MRIVHVGQGREIDLQHVLVVPIGKSAQGAVIAARKGFDYLLSIGFGPGLELWRGATEILRGMVFGILRLPGPGRRGFGLLLSADFAESFLQILKTQPFAPKFFGFVEVLRVWQFVALDGN